jgi:hypothetical protein
MLSPKNYLEMTAGSSENNLPLKIFFFTEIKL